MRPGIYVLWVVGLVRYSLRVLFLCVAWRGGVAYFARRE